MKEKALGRTRILAAVGVFAATAAILIATAGDYGLTLDEPVYIVSAKQVSAWLQGLLGEPGFAASFHDGELQKRWVFAR